MAQAIGYNVLEREESKLSTLKGLLYATTQNKHYEMALDVATHLLEQYPEDAQSYLDLALAQNNAGNKQIALNMLLAIDNGTINPSINFTPLLKTVNNQEEFEIEGSPKGQWLITVKYIGNRIFEDIEPTFLKCTVQYDYGKPTERTEEKVLRLTEKGSEYVLYKVKIN